MREAAQHAEAVAAVAACHRRLGIEPSLLEDALAGLTSQPFCLEATELVGIGLDVFGREQRLLPAAAAAWGRLQAAASDRGIDLQLVSGFRGVEYQAELIARKLARGQRLEDILRVSAAPGFSEHHTGRAVDVTTGGAAPLEVEFETTECFSWLRTHAGEYGFRMSYPRGNPFGIDYEPWHWCYVS